MALNQCYCLMVTGWENELFIFFHVYILPRQADIKASCRDDSMLDLIMKANFPVYIITINWRCLYKFVIMFYRENII